MKYLKIVHIVQSGKVDVLYFSYLLNCRQKFLLKINVTMNHQSLISEFSKLPA